MKTKRYSEELQSKDSTRIPCRYFTHYGNNGVPGSCDQEATLELLSQNGVKAYARSHEPNIYVCDHHASVISLRFPVLGTVEQRFMPI